MVVFGSFNREGEIFVTGLSVVEQIGDTPLLRLRDPAIPPRVEVYAKLEFFNPGGVGQGPAGAEDD